MRVLLIDQEAKDKVAMVKAYASEHICTLPRMRQPGTIPAMSAI
jgi:hypothetical protein